MRIAGMFGAMVLGCGGSLPGLALADPTAWEGAMTECLASVEDLDGILTCVAVYEDACKADPAVPATALCLEGESALWAAKMEEARDVVQERAEEAGAGPAFEAAQARWEDWRAAQCAADEALYGGAVEQDVVRYACIRALNAERYLKFVAVLEGNL